MSKRTYELTHSTWTEAEVRRDVRRWLIKQPIAIVFLAAMWFWAAGTLRWLDGWVLFALYAASIIGQIAAILPHNPELLAERATLRPGTKTWDRWIASFAASGMPVATFVMGGIQYRQMGSTLPAWAMPVGAGLFVLGYAILIWAMWHNGNFAVTVRIQDDRGHRVASSGPYRWVRHPGYVGAVIFTMAHALVMRSTLALIPCVIASLLYIVRTALEDRTLIEELPGYAEYTRETRYRLIPGMW